ncbi:hypothetical protein CHRYSEOSP005_28580 [Chryseobacterium sp. Alg-005]|uniref:hypothetical protein n=1 Tax=Chryseobacterium sp. Alg-005 TaxID=3159516 RepID=UPI003555A38A
MNKIILLSFALFTFSISTAKAQSLFDKIDNAVSKVDKASNTADRASKTGGKVTSLFSKKNKKDNNAGSTAETRTIIHIESIDLASLKKLNSIVSGSTGVSDSKMKYNASSSTITVMHSGSTEKLLDNIQARAKGIISDKNITGFDEGSIEIKMK